MILKKHSFEALAQEDRGFGFMYFRARDCRVAALARTEKKKRGRYKTYGGIVDVIRALRDMS
jgi:hypothetical protein